MGLPAKAALITGAGWDLTRPCATGRKNMCLHRPTNLAGAYERLARNWK